jgi:hypothetical protein
MVLKGMLSIMHEPCRQHGAQSSQQNADSKTKLQPGLHVHCSDFPASGSEL